MTRIEIDVDCSSKDHEEHVCNGKFVVRLVREFGENSTDAESVVGRIEGLVAKSLEEFLKGFLPQYEKILEDATRVAIENAGRAEMEASE